MLNEAIELNEREPVGGLLNMPAEINGRHVENRVVIQPMEGCDCEPDGSPGELTWRKYLRYAKAGAGVIWLEASAVCPEGRTNPRQMCLTEENLDDFRRFTDAVRDTAEKECGFSPLLILQLTHSGRQSMTPLIAYHNPIYEANAPLGDENIATDEYLDALPDKFAHTAALAVRAGFDGVDVKACHGYLMQELLSGYVRAGRYGGSLENRSRAYINSFDAVKAAVPGCFAVTARLGLSDMVKKPWGFGTDEEGNLDLSEPKLLVGKLIGKGLELLNVTIGNPYYNPHVNRPFRVGAYKAPETPETGIGRFYEVEKEIKATFPALKVVASGISYYRENLMEKAEELLADGACDFVGFGRGCLAYPSFYRDYLAGAFDPKKCCVACSKCTFLMRAHCVSGCATFDDYYKKLYKEKGL